MAKMTALNGLQIVTKRALCFAYSVSSQSRDGKRVIVQKLALVSTVTNDASLRRMYDARTDYTVPEHQPA